MILNYENNYKYYGMGSCEYIVQAVVDSQQGVVIHRALELDGSLE
jgi:hypothetical protein